MTDKTCYRCNVKRIVPGDAGEYDSVPCPECTGSKPVCAAAAHLAEAENAQEQQPALPCCRPGQHARDGARLHGEGAAE